MLVFPANFRDEMPRAGHTSGSADDPISLDSSDIEPEPEAEEAEAGGGVWEDDLYPPEAWERSSAPPRATPQPPAARGSSSQPGRRGHTYRPSVDGGGEVWESDLYDAAAWEGGVEGHDLGGGSPEPPPLPAVAVAVAVATHEEIFWPNIEGYISKPAGSRPTVHCAICTNQLVIAGLQERDDSGEAAQEEWEVLPCGHVIGADCWAKWEEVSRIPVKCPVCNAVVD